MTADRILHNTALPYEVHFYAASTLYIKTQLLASIDLTPESRVALRDSLISHISVHSKGNEPLRSKLAYPLLLAWSSGTRTGLRDNLAIAQYLSVFTFVATQLQIEFVIRKSKAAIARSRNTKVLLQSNFYCIVAKWHTERHIERTGVLRTNSKRAERMDEE
jgi:hypothetical protein